MRCRIDVPLDWKMCVSPDDWHAGRWDHNTNLRARKMLYCVFDWGWIDSFRAPVLLRYVVSPAIHDIEEVVDAMRYVEAFIRAYLCIPRSGLLV